MSVTSGFFNSLNHDRRYNAQQMSAIFDGIINDGVFANIGVAFAINADTGVTITVGKGKAWFNSAWVYNDTILPLTLEASEVVLDRIDAVVVEVDHSESVRMGDIKIVKGIPSSSPKRPTMVATDKKSQHPLAYIYRKAGSTEITQANITNMVGTSECPYITGILQVQNIDNIVAQWNAQWTEWYAAKVAKTNSDVAQLNAQMNEWYASKVAETDSDVSEILAEMQAEFDSWFDDFKSVLDDDVASSLAAKVADLMAKFDTLAKEGAVYDEIEDSDLDEILGSDGTPIQGKTVFGAGGAKDIDLRGYATKDDIEKVQDDIEKVQDDKLDRTEKYAHNLLINSDFTNPVNPSGKTSWDAGGECISGWTMYSGDASRYGVSLTSDGLKCNNDSVVRQNLPINVVGYDLLEAEYTLAFWRPDGTVRISHTGIYTSNNRSHYTVPLPDGTWAHASLFEGIYTEETVPRYQAKGYANELFLCKTLDPTTVEYVCDIKALDAYPVGSIYMSVKNTSPASLFGGTWEQLKDRFLLGAGSSYSAGATGGEATHKLTVNEMPSHTHNIRRKTAETLSIGTGNAMTTAVDVAYTDDAVYGAKATGGSTAHNNMPPYLVVYMWKRTA